MAARSTLRARSARFASAAAGALVVWVLAGCSAPPLAEPPDEGPPDAVPGIAPEQLPSLAAQLTSAGRTVYYLGPAARGLELNSFADILDTPSFLAAYGSCDVADGGFCAPPVMVFTAPWEAQPAGFACRPLQPQLSVPTLLVSGEVNLYTGRQVVRVLDVLDGDPPSGDRADHAVALVPQLRPIGATKPAQRLPPPDPQVVEWIAKTCPPGASRS